MSKLLAENILGIDHLAIAVENLEIAICWVRDSLGFSLEEVRETKGKTGGMKSAVLRLGTIVLVLTEGIGENSQITQFLKNFGPGVQHIAFNVKDLSIVHQELLNKGIEFSTPRLDSEGLSQIFSVREKSTGMMIELIERRNYSGFKDENVQRLFDSLESQKKF